MFKGWAILPAAQTLFEKNKVTLQEIANFWGNGTVMVMKKPNGQMHFIAGAAGDYAPVGKFQECYHDQTGAQFGTWQVVNVVKYHKDADGTFHFTGETGVDMTMKAAMAVFK